MKNYYFLFLLFIGAKCFSQITYSPNVYYVIPPTNGCNGVLAVKDTSTCIMAVYNFSPTGCIPFNNSISHTNGDTTFFNLCSIPCNILAMGTNSGNLDTCWFCGVGYNTSVQEKNNTNNISVAPNPFTETVSLITTISGEKTLKLYSASGVLVDEIKFIDTSYIYNTKDLKSGIYFVSISGELSYSNFIKIVKQD